MPVDPRTRALCQIAAHRPRYGRYARYYDGDHDLSFATAKFRNAFGRLFEEFAENLCPAVVNAVGSRLEVIGFDVAQRVSGDAAGSESADALRKAAWQVWTDNLMDLRSSEVHTEALRAGDAYVIVWPDAAGRSIIYPNQAAAMTVGYDEEAPRTLTWAAKTWWLEDERRWRLNLYYPDRIEKYATQPQTESTSGKPGKPSALPEQGAALEPFEVAGEAWPLPNPFGVVPVVHFANNADLRTFGRSELRDVIPLQDALNKSNLDRIVAMEFVALPQRWITGYAPEFDEETGKAIAAFRAAVDNLWTVDSPEARFGQFDVANLEQFITVADDARKAIAVVSQTPFHYIVTKGDTWPSGESLSTAEAPFVAKITNRQTVFGNGWEAVIKLALRMQDAAGAEEVTFSTQWREAAPRSGKELLEQSSIKVNDLGVPQSQVWREIGYTDEQIKQMETERAATDAATGERLLRFAEAGGVDRDA